MAFFNFGGKNNKSKTNSPSDKITKEISQEESLKEKIEQKLSEIEHDEEFANILPLIIDYTKITKDFGYLEKFLDIYIEKEIFITATEEDMQLYSDIINLVSINSINIKSLEILGKISNLKIVPKDVDKQKVFYELFIDKLIEYIFELNERRYIEKIPFMSKNYALKRMVETSKEKNKFDILVSYLSKIEPNEEHNTPFSYFLVEKYDMEYINEAIELSIYELTKDIAYSNSISDLVKFGDKYPSIYKNKKIFDYILSIAVLQKKLMILTL